MFTQCRIDDSTIEQDLRSVGNLVEEAKRLFKLLVIIAVQGGNPRFNFLQVISLSR